MSRMRFEDHPTAERAAAALEAAGLNPYLLLDPRTVARTQYPEVGLAVTTNQFTLLSVEEVPVPALGPAEQEAVSGVALDIARRWGLTWRGKVEPGQVTVAFGTHVRYLLDDDPDETGLRLHETILAVHHAHQTLRQRVLHTAWRDAQPPSLPTRPERPP